MITIAIATSIAQSGALCSMVRAATSPTQYRIPNLEFPETACQSPENREKQRTDKQRIHLVFQCIGIGEHRRVLVHWYVWHIAHTMEEKGIPNNVGSRLRSYRAFPAGPTPRLDPLRTPPPGPNSDPDFDLILTRFGPEKVKIGSSCSRF